MDITTTAADFAALNSRNAIKAAKDITDATFLAEALEAEQAGKARVTVIGALQMRMDALKDAGEADVQVDVVEDPTVDADEPGREDDAVEAPTNDDDTTPAEPTPVDNCARAFLAALKSGDVNLAAVMIAEVRRENADDAAMAAALVAEYAKLGVKGKGRSTRAPKPPGAASSRIVAKIQAAVDLCTPDNDGIVRITKAEMDAAGWTLVWRKYPEVWNRGKSGNAALKPQGIAARELGYTAELTNPLTDEVVVTLTPIKS